MLTMAIFWICPATIYPQSIDSIKTTKMDTTQSTKDADSQVVVLIDKLTVPAAAKQEFMERLTINRDILKGLHGFLKDAVYEWPDDKGDQVYITVAVWVNKDAVEKAKQAVQAEYQKEGFNLQEMLKRLHITMERGIY
jgi:heme-degrading monooxygenase HmoA